jgi:hypothetical protein
MSSTHRMCFCSWVCLVFPKDSYLKYDIAHAWCDITKTWLVHLEYVGRGGHAKFETSVYMCVLRCLVKIKKNEGMILSGGKWEMSRI